MQVSGFGDSMIQSDATADAISLAESQGANLDSRRTMGAQRKQPFSGEDRL